MWPTLCLWEVLVRLLGRIPEGSFTPKGVPRMATRILIADDYPTIRLLLRRLLEKQGDWQVWLHSMVFAPRRWLAL
jgi:hypothetical protein